MKKEAITEQQRSGAKRNITGIAKVIYSRGAYGKHIL
jgi:hypothetical protein